MRVVMLPYARQSLDESDIAAVTEVLRSEWLTQGPAVGAFEEALASAVGARYAVAVASGTAGLHLGLLAAGLGSGDVVLTSPITFVASANCALYCGARPDFIDIDSTSVCLDPDALEAYLQSGIAPGTVRAVIPVHFGGHPADLVRIAAIARSRGVLIIEDACHALGAKWTDRSADVHRIGDGSHADMAVFSFHPVKHITTGEGGAITTNDQTLYNRLIALRSHGITRDPSVLQRREGPWYYEMQALGYNYRITDFQSALGRSQLTRLEHAVARRREIAARYDAAFCGHPLFDPLAEPAGAISSYHLYVLRLSGAAAPRRREIFVALRAEGLGVNVHYIPVPWQPYYQQRFGYKLGQFPRAEDYYRCALTIPLHTALSDRDVDFVIQTVRRVVESVAGYAHD
jgi:UDP-4-amino-4,6-dideoxy-N-acetyl-beta-L-altrosamine transaminase